jgi:hypothetical protein
MTISIDGHGLTIESVVRVAATENPSPSARGETANPPADPARGQDPNREIVRREYGHRRRPRSLSLNS